MSGPIGKIYSLDEAAEYMRIGKRQLAKLAKVHGLCSVVGREILLSEYDIQQVWDVIRCAPASPMKADKASSPPLLGSDRAFAQLLKHVDGKAKTKDRPKGRR